MITGEGIAVAPRQVGVRVAEIEREHLVGESHTDIPGVVIGIVDAIRECRDTVEAIRSSKPLPAELAGNIHAYAAAAEDGARRSEFASDRGVVAPSPGVQEAWRVVFIGAELPHIVDNVVYLCVALEEAHISFDHVAVKQRVSRALGAQRLTCEIERRAIEASPARIQVTPNAEVKGECAEGRADTAVNVDFSSRAVRERNALAGKADIK